LRVRRLILDRDDVNLSRVERNTIVGSELPLAMLYANVREFPAFLKRALPYDAVHVLNRYYAQIGETILANGGHIDRYTSGGIFALFGIKGEDAKTKCTNAIRAALRMSKRMAPLNAYLNEHFGTTFTFDAGLHYGRMTVGHIGHPDQQRLTALGDAANVAIAVSALNETHDSTILVPKRSRTSSRATSAPAP
jgi:adenylate cyclase